MNIPDNLRKYLAEKPKGKIDGRLGQRLDNHYAPNPNIDFLKGEFGESVLKEYNEIVDKKYNGNEILKVLKFENNRVVGSNAYSNVLMAEILNGRASLPRPCDVAHAEKLYGHIGIARPFYIEYGLVFLNENDYNLPIARHLAPQIEKYFNKMPDSPIVMLSEDLELVNDDYAVDELNFDLKPDAKPFLAPNLLNNMYWIQKDENGMPIPASSFLGSGLKQRFYAKTNGLLRLSLDTNTTYSIEERTSLGSSTDNGRVAVMRDE